MASPLHVRSSHLALGKRASTRSSIPLSAVSKAQVPIREAKREDLPRIRQAILKEKMNPLGHDHRRFLVATAQQQNDEIRGFGQVELKGVSDQGHQNQWELRSLVVLPEYRGQGVGSALVDALKTRVAPEDVFLVTLSATQDFYKRLGFAVTSSPPPWLQPEVAVGQVVSRLAGYTDGLVVMAWQRSNAG